MWQDEHNMAALLLYRQPGHQHYSLVSSGPTLLLVVLMVVVLMVVVVVVVLMWMVNWFCGS